MSSKAISSKIDLSLHFYSLDLHVKESYIYFEKYLHSLPCYGINQMVVDEIK